ncbi:MAG TPA: porin [Hypericibacter adhaerens]|uniref:Porin n=1 Tax=Hypericibacter adhaerens TaxID=2602016 RepID=A0A5J6N5E3_9PROT|nr:porin [Hypericibacter adhaerens]QEX25131.1 porin [Hypericibacter adhaerens]HWA42054.1 porin [Hypericibacter adhaerens]
MKNVLLGTTALVAAGLVASHAEAAQGVQLGIGGYYAAAAGLLFDQSDGNGDPGDHTRDIVFRQDVEIHFKGETTLDNGLTVGARVELEGQQSTDQIDEVWAYFKGGWGELRFGDDDDATEQLGYIIPSASNIFGVDTPYFEFANNHGGFTNGVFQTNSTLMDISSDATKIIYFSPTFAGFSFAASFAPDRRGEDTYSYWSGPGGTTNSNNTGQVQNVFAAALNFDHDFNGVSLATGVGFAEGQWETKASGANVDTTWGVNGHLDVSFSGFTIGGSGMYRDNWQSSAGTDYWVAGIGATYNWDAWTVGLAWSHGDYEYTPSNDDDKIDIVEFTGRYDLGPGISLDGMVGYNDMNAGDTGHQDDKTWEAGVGFYIGF